MLRGSLREIDTHDLYIYVGRSSRDVFDIWRSRIRASSSSFTEKQVRERKKGKRGEGQQERGSGGRDGRERNIGEKRREAME